MVQASKVICVLLLEDDLDDIKHIVSCLPRRRYKVFQAKSLREALEILTVERLDVIICDLSLPDSDYTQTFDHLASKAAGVPIVVVSSFGDFLLQEKVLAHGGQDFICKDDISAASLYRSLEFAIFRQSLVRQEKEIRLKLASQSNYKSKFMTHFSHEIRTPLNAVLGCTDLLRHTNLDSEQTQLLDSVQDGGERILEMVSDILDLAKIEAGKFSLVPSVFDFYDFMDKFFRLHRSKALQKNISLTYFIDKLIPKYIYTDEKRYFQIATNLVSNAIKYTNHGGVDVQVHLKSEKILQTKIIDTGRGIDPGLEQKLFKPFLQLDPRDMLTGTGVGLSISRELVTLLKGEIGVLKNTPCGSVFWFEIPISVSKDLKKSSKREIGFSQPVAIAKDHSKDVKLSGMEILIVDDDHLNHVVLNKMLAQWNIKTDRANDGLEALKKVCSDRSYDLVFMDCSMPNLDGWKATEKIRQMGIDTPIVALTANAYEDQKKKCEKSGMDYFLTKPVRQKQIEDMILKISESRHKK